MPHPPAVSGVRKHCQRALAARHRAAAHRYRAAAARRRTPAAVAVADHSHTTGQQLKFTHFFVYFLYLYLM